MLPAAAAAFALGLLGAGATAGWLEPWMALAAGLGLLGAGWLAAGHERRGPGALARAGLVAPDHEAVEAVGGRRVVSSVTPLIAAVVSLVGVLTLGVGWGAFHDRALDGALLASLAPERVVLTGTLKTDPKEATLGWSAVAQVRSVEWPDGAATLRSSIWVSGSDEVPRARRGDRVRLEGTLRVPDDAGFAEALRHKGIPAQLQLHTLTRLGPSSSAFIRATQSVRRIVGRSIEGVFPPKEAGLLLGLLLGDDSQLDAGLERDFRASGLSHLLVVSGGNVAMVLAPVLAATTLLRLPRWPKFAVGFGAVAFFTILTGAEPSVLRAGVMACLALVGMLAGRPRTTASILSAAVLGLLVLDPWLVRSVGFQLSVTATAGMVALASPLAERFGRFVPGPIAAAAGATVSAQLGVTPVLLYHFHEVPLATLPANLAAFPLVAPSLLLGAVAAGTGLVWFPSGGSSGALALLPMRWLEFVADHLGKAPVGYLTAEGGSLVLVGGTALVAAIVVWVRTGWKPSRPLDRGRDRVDALLRLGVRAGDRTARGAHGSVLRRGTGRRRPAHHARREPRCSSTAVLSAIRSRRSSPRSRSSASTSWWPVTPTPITSSGCRRSWRGSPWGSSCSPDARASRRRSRPTWIARSPTRGSRCRTPARETRSGSDPPARRPVTRPVLDGDRVRCQQRRDRDPCRVRRRRRADRERARGAGAGVAAGVRGRPPRGHPQGSSSWRRDLRSPSSSRRSRPTPPIVSVGENDYGHPTAFTLDALAASGAQVWRTDRQGTITVVFAGPNPTVEFERWR